MFQLNSALMFADIFSIIEQLGGKQMVMQLLAHEDSNVRYEALLAVQKLMVHNWFV
jgi:V-type H+-transporting ATPase subunit H